MRLNSYLNELTMVSDKEIEELLDAGFNSYKKIMSGEKFKFWPLILEAIQRSFEPLNIRFIPRWIAGLAKIKKTTKASTNVFGLIKVIVTIKEIKSLKSDSGINNLKNKLRTILSHELTHRKQMAKMPIIALKQMKTRSSGEYLDYLSDPMEIESFAREAAYEIQKGESETIITYYNIVRLKDKKVWRKFLKKLYQYCDELGYNTFKIWVTLTALGMSEKEIKDIITKFDKTHGK